MSDVTTIEADVPERYADAVAIPGEPYSFVTLITLGVVDTIKESL